ncbi:hypothetical protein LTR70_004379 [Exophiala xenobiotica]|uniref:Myb-like domain-containing protein n=1 Tax=Lithohypha guttulata TaxID=1690604 RepID=A0ABR0KLB7_9EURO|nr:hypothetical protein LTR24_001956 [Lithohypha guttulata]KAK5320969.1 hypothetical protein LTR70_004379 [Exophiala xenobiotica]
MSSFSSVIKKPGAKVAPKVAPRRNIVRKVPQSQSNSNPTPPVASEQPVNAAEPETSQIPPEASVEVTGARVADDVEHQTQPVEHSARQDNVAQTQNNNPTEPSADPTAPDLTQAPIPNWPAQKRRPESNSVTPKPSEYVPTTTSQAPRPTSSASDGQAEQAGANRGSLSTSRSAASPETPRPRSKRKQPPRGSAKVILAQPAVLTPPTTQPSRSPTQERRPSEVSQRAPPTASQRSEAEEALDRINAQLQKVGDIAAGIVRSTPAPETSPPDAEGTPEQTADGPRPRKRRKKNNAGPQTIQDQAAEVVANAIGHSELAPHRRRNATPEDAEEHQIEEESTTMFDLCDEKHKYGKTSEIEKQMKANWQEILKRRKEDAAERLARSLVGRRGKNKMQIPEDTGNGSMGEVPNLVIQDGQIVVSSREIDRQAATTTVANAVLEDEVRDDTDIYKRINSSTVGPSRSQIAPGQQWDDLNTDLFYQGLKMFGTDFKMISNMIPGKNRRQVKLKYNAEERSNWAKVQRCLSQKQEVNLETYATMTGLEFGSVSDVYKTMEDDEKQLREEDERRRREEGIISQQQDEDGTGEADVPLPSIEGQDSEAAAAAADADGQPVASGERQSTTAVSRVGSTTTGRHTAQPQATKKKQQSRKSTTTSKRGRQANAKNKGFEGVEERLGNATEVGIPGA